jgi:hypothetical protein
MSWMMIMARTGVNTHTHKSASTGGVCVCLEFDVGIQVISFME